MEERGKKDEGKKEDVKRKRAKHTHTHTHTHTHPDSAMHILKLTGCLGESDSGLWSLWTTLQHLVRAH